MEKLLFDQIVARLQDAAVIAWFTSNNYAAVKTKAWFENQVEDLLAKNVQTFPMDFPAVLIEFSDTKLDNRQRNRQTGNGKITLHIVQNRIAQDGSTASATFINFDASLDYANIFSKLFDGFKLPCAALLTQSGSKVDHKNRALRDDELYFEWTYTRKKPSGVPGF